MIEGCSTGEFELERGNGDVSQVYYLSYSGTATYGVDYDTLPAYVIFDQGELTKSLTINPFYDGFGEGLENLIITVTYVGDCGNTVNKQVTLQIVEQEELILALPDTVKMDCPGESVPINPNIIGGMEPLTYSWNSGQTFANVTLGPDSTQVYTLSIEDVCGDQFVSSDVVVFVPIHAELELDAGNDVTTLCPNSPVALSASGSGGDGNYAYLWSTGEVTPTIEVQTMESQTYSVAITDGCGRADVDDVQVEVELEPLSTEAFGDAQICPGESTTIGVVASGGAGGYTYLWSNGSTVDIQDVSPAGTMTFEVEVSDACQTYYVTDSVEVQIVKPDAAFSLKNDDVAVGKTVYFINESEGAVSYYWDFGNGESSIMTDPNTIYDEEGQDTVILIATDANGCLDTTELVLNVNPNLLFYVPNAFSPNGDGLNDTFFGEGVGIKTVEFWVYDRWGHQVFYSDQEGAVWDGTEQGQELPIGVYVWRYKLKGYDGTHFYHTGHVTIVK